MSTICTLITGAGSGIGQRIAIQLSGNSNLILCGRNTNKLKATYDQCNNKRTHFIWEFDLENVSGIKESLEQFLSKNELNVDAFIANI